MRKVKFLTDIGLWPSEMATASEVWLDNFNTSLEDESHATSLLYGFQYFNDRMMSDLLYSSFQKLSRRVIGSGSDFQTSLQAWSDYVRGTLVTYVRGETMSPADSGRAYIRRARTVLGLAEEQLKDPEEAVEAVARGGVRAVVFIDDFLGSGSQFVWTWRTHHGQTSNTFESVAASSKTEFWYCPALACRKGIDRIESECDPVRVSPGNVIPIDESTVLPNGRFWPEALAQTGPAFIDRASRAIGATGIMADDSDPKGFDHLGLAIAHGDSVPDATIPLIRWDRNSNFHPLVRRR